MRITCPKCEFYREVAEGKVPASSSMATCPKCGLRFKFRETSPAAPVAEPGPGPRRGGEAEPDAASERRDQTGPDREAARPSPVGGDRSWRRQVTPVAPETFGSGQDLAPPADLADIPPGEPRPDEPPARGGAPFRSREPAEPAEPTEPVEPAESVGATASARSVAPGSEPGRPARSEPSSRPGPGTDPGDGPGRGSASLGSDGVRDIWARLRAMDEEGPGSGPDSGTEPGRDQAPREEGRQGKAQGESDPVPWERLDLYGFGPGIFLTLKKILLAPVEFFEALPPGRPRNKALVFNLLVYELLFVIDFLWSLSGVQSRVAGSGPDVLGGLAGASGPSILLTFLLVPFLFALGVYLDAGLTHLLLLLFRSAKKGFNETFRVLCYSCAPVAVSTVPVLGQLLSPLILVWYMSLQAIGLKKVHDAAYTQVLAAVFIKWSVYLFLLLAMLQGFSQGR